MLDKEELRKQLIQYFRSVGSGQNLVQCIKETLFLHQQFSPVLLFEVLSKGKQKLTSCDIRSYLVSHKILFGEDEFKYYLHQNSFKKEISLNEFLQAMIPYNADVVRQFKARYLKSLEIRQFYPQVEFIFSQLLKNELEFYKSLINIRLSITNISTQKQIQTLIKEDLINNSRKDKKIREANKFQENFRNKHFQLSFHQLRKFLESSENSKEIIHQFYLINIMRHLKSNRPFEKIVFKSKKYRSQSASGQKRAQSAAKKNKETLTNQKIKEFIAKDQKSQTGSYFFSGYKDDKYGTYKNEVIKDYIKDRENSDFKRSPLKKSRNVQPKSRNVQPSNEVLPRSKYQRSIKGIDGTYLIHILQEIVKKEEILQKLRKDLAKSNDFNLINLFKLIDERNKGFVTSQDINDFINSGKVKSNYMVSFYAREHEKLRLSQFCLIFRPLSRQLNELIDLRPQHKVPNPFKKQTMRLILQVLFLTAEMFSNINQAKVKIGGSGVNIGSLFRLIDLQGRGQISCESLQIFMKESNIACDQTGLKCLMKYFRKKVDQTISLQEFHKFIDL